MIQIYKLVLGRKKDLIDSLSLELLENFDETFMSKRTLKRTPTDEHVYHDRQVVNAFTKAGYTLKSDGEDEDGWAPLNQVKQTGTLSVDLN